MRGDIKAVAFDIDGTLVKENFWGVLNKFCGVSQEEDMRLCEAYFEKRLEYRAWMGLLAAQYREMRKRKADIEAIFMEYRFDSAAKRIIKRLGERYELALISSNIDVYVEDVGNRLTIPFRYAFSKMVYDDGGLLTDIGFTSDGDELEHKVSSLKDLCSRLLLKPEQVAFVGDSRNDFDAFRYTGRGILLREGNEELRQAAWKQISTLSELEGIL